MPEYKRLYTSISVFPPGENPIFSEMATQVSLDDDAGGIYLVIQQSTDANIGTQKVKFNDMTELMAVVDAAKELLSQEGVSDGI